MACATTRRILVMANDFMLATEISDALEDAGYEIAGPVLSVLEAKRIVGVDGVDGAVIDTDLKCGNSLVLATQVARQGAPVLIITDPSRQHLGNAERNLGRLQRPFSTKELLQRVGGMFAPSPAPITI